jgi:hypothetical protein
MGKEDKKAVQRLRRTTLGLVGAFSLLPALHAYVRLANTRTDTYAGYFTARALDAPLPLLQYVLGALVDPDAGICLEVRLFLCLGCVVLFVEFSWR